MEADNCVQLRQQLQHHPIAVGITGLELFLYRSGVFSDCDRSINHAVLLVGYQEDKGWRIKNTWGTRWGEKGFAWISKENNCRICNFAQYPVPMLPNN